MAWVLYFIWLNVRHAERWVYFAFNLAGTDTWMEDGRTIVLDYVFGYFGHWVRTYFMEG